MLLGFQIAYTDASLLNRNCGWRLKINKLKWSKTNADLPFLHERSALALSVILFLVLYSLRDVYISYIWLTK